MPRFQGCEDIDGDDDAKKSCADQKMLEFIYNHLSYPKKERKAGKEGTAVISFVIEKDGSISEIIALRDPSPGLTQEAIRLVQLFNNPDKRWTPGKLNGKPVRVEFHLPIRFKLSSEKK